MEHLDLTQHIPHTQKKQTAEFVQFMFRVNLQKLCIYDQSCKILQKRQYFVEALSLNDTTGSTLILALIPMYREHGA